MYVREMSEPDGAFGQKTAFAGLEFIAKTSEAASVKPAAATVRKSRLDTEAFLSVIF